MCTHDDGHEPAIHDRGLGHDLQTLDAQQRSYRGRRAALGLLGAGAAATAGGLVLLNTGGAGAALALASGTGTSTSAGTCGTEIPNETAGPYPGDGSNGPDALAQSGIVRRDIRSSFGDADDGVATGVGLKIVLTLQDTDTCEPVKGLAVYAWHCDKLGRYSMYSSGVEDENYLRGVQISGAKGRVTFTTIYPGCYSGRWPHVHFEVYRSRYAATHDGTILATSQLALPRQQSMAVYRSDNGYTGSEANLNRISLSSDNVFGDDGGARQLATMSGSVSTGYTAKLVVPVDL